LTIYYESNRFNEANLVKWEHKARKAFERLAENLPTVSKMVSKPENFEQVGYISSKGILIRRMEKLHELAGKVRCLDGAPQSGNHRLRPAAAAEENRRRISRALRFRRALYALERTHSFRR
jgi:hypothetical protein